MRSFGVFYRSLMEKGDARRDEGLTVPDDVEQFCGIVYGPDKAWNVLDVYRPAGITGFLPVIISIHGGGWCYGNKEAYQFYCMSLAEKGFAVVNFSYRLAPEHKFPAAMEDINLTVEWVLKNAETYGMDIGRMFMVGDSAGGHLAALYACVCTNTKYAAQYSFSVPETFRLKGLGLNCGIYDVTKNRRGLIGRLVKELLGKKRTVAQMQFISPCNYVTQDFPPAYIMTAEGDFLKKDAVYLKEKMELLGLTFKYRKFGDKKNKLSHVFHCNIKLPEAEECNSEECEFFMSL